MKEIYFVRHGKSDWGDVKLSDHDRPLATRGKRDAPRMARRLIGYGIAINGVLTSTAKRAKQTAKVFAEAYGLGKGVFLTDESLYHASPREIERAIRKLPGDWDQVLLFGHNPGYTDLANQLSADEYIDNVPTCGIVASRCDVTNWEDWTLAAARRTAFYYPKQEQ